jgi:hypothetical protein
MLTTIENETYITKFFYGPHKNPTKGKWRNRSTTCRIYKMTAPKTLDMVAEIKVKNCHGEMFVKGIGRKLSFLKAIQTPALEPFAEILLESFEEQCPSSLEFDVSELLRRPSEAVSEA